MPIYSAEAVFSRGELSPKLHARADLEQFKSGLKYLENMLVMRQGGIKRRPGTQYVGEVKSSGRAVLIPFTYNASQAYVLEVGDFYFRVYSQGGRVGTVEVTTPWAVADIFALDYDQTNDVLDLTHRLYQPQRISRLSNTSWSVAAVATKDGPYLPLNATATAITPSGTGNAIPVMTSNTAPSGTASTNGNNAASVYLCMDGDSATYWYQTNFAGSTYVEYDFPASKIIAGYALQCGNFTSIFGVAGLPADQMMPKSWTFEAYNGTIWVIIDTQFGQSGWSLSETRFYPISNATAYSNYRINVSANNGAGAFMAIASFAFQEDISTAAAVTLTASAVTGINSNTGFQTSDVGRLVTVLGKDATFHPFQISAYTSTTVVSAKLTGAPLLTAQATLQWKLGAWGTTPGWPAHVCTFEGRKCYARTDAQPSGVWGTKSGGYGTSLDFGTTVPTVADDAITFLLADANEIGWIAEGQSMAMGTAGSARTLGRDSQQNPFSALNFRQTLVSKYGSQPIRPVQVGSSTIFASLFGKALREFVLSQDGVTYDTPDITVLSEHLLASGAAQIAYAQEPDSIIWTCNGNGELIGLTYEKNQAMAGLHRHFLAGAGGFVESVCTIPGTDRTELWLIVRRTINGSTKRYIERMAASFEGSYMAAADAWYLDCALQYSGAPVSAVTGLSHLEGQTVGIIADGAREADAVVVGGGVSLASGRAASKITVGLTFRSRARTLPSPVSMGDGSGLNRRKRTPSAILDVLETGSLKVGRSVALAEEIDFRALSDTVGSAVPLYTGSFTPKIEGSWSDKGEVEMVADGVLPATVRSITLQTDPEP